MWFTTGKEIDDIKRRLKELECGDHKTYFSDRILTEHCGCGKVARFFNNEKDFLLAKNKRMAESIKENEEKIKDLQIG